MKLKRSFAAILAAAMLISSAAVNSEAVFFYPEYVVDEFPSDVNNDEEWEEYDLNLHPNGGPSMHVFRYNSDDFRNCSDKVVKLSYTYYTGKWVTKQIPNAPEGMTRQARETAYGGIGTPLEDPELEFIIYMKDHRTYSKIYNINEKMVYTIKDIVEACGVEDPENIAVVGIELWSCSFGFAGAEVSDFTPGWNEIDGSTYYIKRDGTMTDRPCTINGVLYNFTAGGVCKGRYTGFAKTAKGMVYYKNGVRVKNKTLRTKDGARYKADKYGYLTKTE